MTGRRPPVTGGPWTPEEVLAGKPWGRRPVEPDPDDTRPAPKDRCIHCGGWGVFDFGDSEGDCGHCDGTGIEPM